MLTNLALRWVTSRAKVDRGFARPNPACTKISKMNIPGAARNQLHIAWRQMAELPRLNRAGALTVTQKLFAKHQTWCATLTMTSTSPPSVRHDLSVLIIKELKKIQNLAFVSRQMVCSQQYVIHLQDFTATLIVGSQYKMSGLNGKEHLSVLAGSVQKLETLRLASVGRNTTKLPA